LAATGDTYDIFLTTKSGGYPFLVMASVTKEGKYYWAKVLSEKKG
jgi:hypothetical protein